MFEHWHIDPPSAGNQLRNLDAIIGWDTSSLVVIWGGPGTGKTFYSKLAAYALGADLSCRDALEITFEHLSRVGILGRGGLKASHIALCIHQRISLSSSLASKSPPEAIKARGEYDDHLAILAKCAHLAEFVHPERGNAKLYVFLDGLDKAYYQPGMNKDVARKAIWNFIGGVAGGAGGPYLAVRVFLPADLKEEFHYAVPLGLASSISKVTLIWKADAVQEIAEKRLQKSWMNSAARPAHLPRFLDQDAMQQLRNHLKNKEKDGTLCPREVIETLSAVANQAAAENLLDEVVPADVFRRALQNRTSPPREKRLLDSKWFWLLPVLVMSVALWHYLPACLWLIQLVISLSQAAARAVDWLAAASDRIEAIVLLAAVLAVGLFGAWCLGYSFRTGRRSDLRRCLKQVWHYVRKHLRSV